MNNENFKKLLREYKQTVIKESYNEGKLIKALASDAGNTVDLWLAVELDEFMNGDKQTQYDLVKNSFDNYIEDVYDDIEDDLPDDIDIDKWLNKNRKKIIIAIIKKINR